jgi:hypothetical protein
LKISPTVSKLNKMFEPIFTKEFLDKELNREVVSFKVGPGSKPGDNFSGAIYAFDVKLKLQSEDGRIRNISTSPGEETETVHLVGKFYPNNADHWWLNHSSIFHKELNIYNTLIRAFEEFVEDYFPVDNNQNETEEMLSLPFAQIFGGKAIDFSKIKGTPTPVLPNLILSGKALIIIYTCIFVKCVLYQVYYYFYICSVQKTVYSIISNTDRWTTIYSWKISGRPLTTR